ncbi:peptidase M1-like protein [Prauserella shujinwangii]|uniref:Aminopeptidase N n=1 Tax=Prauserella shujinwangii TaxID=1453103 RepID=A0A2T0M1Q6_9PSEU|nr:M1 family metallopeptidase [Prauserella shujinwangii]PRX50501.1 peptidase M1-like protein [Prauserella shujinwangii]
MVHDRVRTLLLCGLVSTLVACTGGEPDEPRTEPGAASPGASGIGDPYYPDDGNGGYDATGYEVSVRYDPGTGRLDGDTTVTARATQDLSRFNLDLRGFTVSSVEVDGGPAEFTRESDTELVVTPADPVREGSTFATRVRYSGAPLDATSAQLGDNGWQRSPSGGAFVLGEPHSAAYWYPVNEHPRDKATFRLTARVPSEWTAVSIGRRESSRTADGWTTSTWVEPNPVASYLTTIAIDRFDVVRGTLADGTPVLSAYAPGANDLRDEGDRVGEIIDFLEGEFGEYPQATAGGIYLGADVGFSLETQGRPTYTRTADLETVVHELAHQWWGNTVSVRSWADICLNECLASYSQWLWAEDKEGDDLDARYRRAIDRFAGSAQFWGRKLYDMGPGHEFEGVYSKGILALHALRREIGEDAFGRLLREFPAQHRNGNASWPQFENHAEKLAGRQLDGFLDAWFRGTEQPPDEYLYPGSLRG